MCFRTLRHRSPANILCCKIGVFLRKSKFFPLFVRLPPPEERLLPSREDPNSVPRAGGGRRAGFRRSRREVPANGVLSCGKAVVRGLVGPSSGGPVERRSRRGGAVVRGLVEPLSGGPVAECRRTRAVVRGACVRSYCRAPAPPRQGTPAGYLSGSTWMAIIVPAPKRARRRCSMSTVSACEWATLIAPSTRRCGACAGCAAPEPRDWP